MQLGHIGVDNLDGDSLVVPVIEGLIDHAGLTGADDPLNGKSTGQLTADVGVGRHATGTVQRSIAVAASGPPIAIHGVALGADDHMEATRSRIEGYTYIIVASYHKDHRSPARSSLTPFLLTGPKAPR